MDIYQLKVFLSVYRNRSFSRASEELHITQPSVSAHIKRLEEELGVRLFDRVGRKTLPTKEADLLNVRSDEIVRKLGDIKADLAGLEREVKGLLSIGAGSIPGSYILPSLAAGFRDAYPEVFFQVLIKDSSEILGMISGGELMLGLVEKDSAMAGLKTLHVIEDELVLVARPGFIGKKTITPVGLLKVPLLMREDGSDARESMQKQHLLHKVSLKALNITAILGSTDSVREAVKSGLGAAILSRHYLLAHERRPLPSEYQAFVDFIVKSSR
jgi:DNA-binding transcriptional LysR family regulator